MLKITAVLLALAMVVAFAACGGKDTTQQTDANPATDAQNVSSDTVYKIGVIQLLEQVAELNMKHKLIPGSLEWVIGQQKVQDDTGRKGFQYTVLAHVMADEPRWTEEEIRKEIEDTRKRMRLETEAMFADEEEKADG
jgi:hypothetical protein